MSNNNNCQQCAPNPCSHVVPPPTCATSACEEYIQSDCVVSTIEEDCTGVFQGPDGDVQVGLTIQEGTTLTSVYQQLTSTACPLNPDVIGATLQIIQGNPVLNQIFCAMVCACSCDDPCDGVQQVEQLIFTDIGENGFDITFTAQPDYNYYIRINDMNTLPQTYYVYDSSTNPTPFLPNITPAPTSVTLSTNSFSIYVNNLLIPSPPGGAVLASGTTFEVFITAIAPDSLAECENGPFTVVTLPDAACNCNSDIQLTDSSEGDPGLLSIDITELSGDTPVAYQITITDDVSGSIVVGPIDITRDGTGTTTYTDSLPDGPYTVEVIPLCSLVPRCAGDPFSIDVVVSAVPACAPPDITTVTIVS
jgi:hypothetical protein